MKVLFVCTGNAGRSQIAQAMFRRLVGGKAEVESAGVQPWDHLHPMAVRIMTERGFDLKGHFPKPVAAAISPLPDAVVTIGPVARDRIPSSLVNATRWIHWDIADPADADGTPESEPVFRRCADAIEKRLPQLLDLVGRMDSARLGLAKPGVATCLWAPGRFEPARHLPEAASAGFGSIELNLFFGKNHFDYEDDNAVAELRHVARDLGVLVWSIHSPDVASLASSDEQERARQITVLRFTVQLAEELGAKIVVSHGLLLGPSKKDPAYNDPVLCQSRFLQAVETLAPEIEASPVTIAFENGYAMRAGLWGRDVLNLVNRSSRPAFGFVLDTGHANIAGDQAEIAGLLGDRLISLHLNDNNGKADSHLPPGEGTVNWAAVAQTLRDVSYSGCRMYEVLAGKRDPREILAAVKRAVV